MNSANEKSTSLTSLPSMENEWVSFHPLLRNESLFVRVWFIAKLCWFLLSHPLNYIKTV